jgi:DNA mismatch repair ATPase MutL
MSRSPQPSEKRTSLPVGTTVRVDRFLETLPVRRQAAEKASVKTLAKIKRVLQAYALARPSLRLSLKVLKAKNEKANWKYPKNTGVGNSRNSASYFSAAIDVIGKNVTDQCQWISSTWSSAGEQIDTALGAQDVVAATDSFTFDTVLATPGCGA